MGHCSKKMVILAQKRPYMGHLGNHFISVFDIHNVNDFAKQFDDYGNDKIEFSELAKVWEDNKYEVWGFTSSNVCSSQIFRLLE